MKNHTLFSSKDKSKKLKCRLLQVLFRALKIYSLVGNIKMTLGIISCNTSKMI